MEKRNTYGRYGLLAGRIKENRGFISRRKGPKGGNKYQESLQRSYEFPRFVPEAS
jgi:hypothetical protein